MFWPPLSTLPGEANGDACSLTIAIFFMGNLHTEAARPCPALPSISKRYAVSRSVAPRTGIAAPAALHFLHDTVRKAAGQLAKPGPLLREGNWHGFCITREVPFATPVARKEITLIHAAHELRLHQQTALTPRLQQSVKLLQMSALEFNQEVRQALVENPFLEEDEEAAASAP